MEENRKVIDVDIIDLSREEVTQTKDFVEPEDLHNQLLEKVKKYHPSGDLSQIETAYKVAYNAHKGQLRKSGEPYIIHPLCVAIILADLELDKETIISCMEMIGRVYETGITNLMKKER